MRIETEICEGVQELEDFLNHGIDYETREPEDIILGITQDRMCMYYTVIYKVYE